MAKHSSSTTQSQSSKVSKTIILGISGGIAAYKTPHLVRLLVAAGYQVRVCLSPNADKFVAPASLQAVSGHHVYQHQFPPASEDGMEHISLARWADFMLIAPASAALIARLAAGMGDDLLTTLALAHNGNKLLAPAMNQAMWHNPAIQANLATLAARGWQVLPVNNGEQACGEFGAGRMLQPETLVQLLQQHTQPAAWHSWWQGKHVLITAGPTYEAIDPVRFIGNRSSGKMGYALATAAARAGAQVSLISGPTHLSDPPGVTTLRVDSSAEMLAAASKINNWDVCIGAAAIADYAPTLQNEHKQHKNAARIQLELSKTVDLIAQLGNNKKTGQVVVGFCAETAGAPELLARARTKLTAKQLDLIVANQVGAGLVFDQDKAHLWLIDAA